ncbi:MAG TPA: hypothetical protein VN203_10640, partial [Candidatus Acidoferrum sp.]|nr:hypothetical protein [Candidatus Acidoferrum sp.]
MIPSVRRCSFALLGGLVLTMTASPVHGATETKAPRAQESRERLKDVQRELGRERDRFKEAR